MIVMDDKEYAEEISEYMPGKNNMQDYLFDRKNRDMQQQDKGTCSALFALYARRQKQDQLGVDDFPDEIFYRKGTDFQTNAPRYFDVFEFLTEREVDMLGIVLIENFNDVFHPITCMYQETGEEAKK